VSELVCPVCGKKAHRVVCLLLPMFMCSDEHCSNLWGFWSFLVEWWGYPGVVVAYENGTYIQVLWSLLIGDIENGNDKRL